ncbi:hypothetical protein J3Q64DRAFT_1749467 [Phycomyces blakesleeanus]|uniref:Copper transporter n=1 Tax=Phycomyces blakesleeanus TaxID=4837 RepID=A0ABR3AW47_PHYBL
MSKTSFILKTVKGRCFLFDIFFHMPPSDTWVIPPLLSVSCDDNITAMASETIESQRSFRYSFLLASALWHTMIMRPLNYFFQGASLLFPIILYAVGAVVCGLFIGLCGGFLSEALASAVVAATWGSDNSQSKKDQTVYYPDEAQPQAQSQPDQKQDYNNSQASGSGIVPEMFDTEDEANPQSTALSSSTSLSTNASFSASSRDGRYAYPANTVDSFPVIPEEILPKQNHFGTGEREECRKMHGRRGKRSSFSSDSWRHIPYALSPRRLPRTMTARSSFSETSQQQDSMGSNDDDWEEWTDEEETRKKTLRRRKRHG